jgi:hypothetical protein
LFRFPLGSGHLERAVEKKVRRGFAKAFDPTWRETFCAVGCSQESPKCGAV